MTGTVRRFTDLAADVLAAPGPVRLVGVDGCGGAGKTTFAAQLSSALDDCPVVHTDDFASHEEPLEWWPRLQRLVVDPLLGGEVATFHPYDWVARRLADDVVTVEPAAVVVIEGVGATRSAWRDDLAMRVWVDTPRTVRLRRGIERDGEELRDFWAWWMAAEDAYVEAERPWAAADVVVDGDPEITVGSDEFVVLSLSAPR